MWEQDGGAREKIPGGVGDFIEVHRRFSWGMRDPGGYLVEEGEGIARRFEERLDERSKNVVLFSVYSGKGLVWAIDQFSRQNLEGEKMRVIVFQNGIRDGDERKERVEQLVKDTGVEYFSNPEALGAWGARSFAMHNFQEVFGGNFPQRLMTFDEDTAPVSPGFCVNAWRELEKNPNIGVCYSPAVFVTEKGGIDQLKLLGYKAITLTAQRVKIAMGGFHTVGSNAVFSGQALAEINQDDKWQNMGSLGYEEVREDDIARMLLERGYSLRTSFSINRVTYTSADKLTSMGVGDYLRRVALVNVPDIGPLGKLRKIGDREYGAMYGKGKTVPTSE